MHDPLRKMPFKMPCISWIAAWEKPLSCTVFCLLVPCLSRSYRIGYCISLRRFDFFLAEGIQNSFFCFGYIPDFNTYLVLLRQQSQGTLDKLPADQIILFQRCVTLCNFKLELIISDRFNENRFSLCMFWVNLPLLSRHVLPSYSPNAQRSWHSLQIRRESEKKEAVTED